MITKKDIESIYKQYKKRPASVDELNIMLLFEEVSPEHGIEITEDSLVINSIGPMSPFHQIPLRGIHAIIEFNEHVAIVMHSSIIFLNKDDEGVSIHIKPIKRSFSDRLSGLLRRIDMAALA